MKFKNKAFVFFIIVISFLVTAIGCSKKFNEKDAKTKSGYALGTIINIKVYDNVDDKVFDEVFKKLKEIENKMSINLNTSEVIDINNKAGVDYASVSEETFFVIKEAIHYSSISNGNFDITVGPYVKLWNIGTDKERIPSESEINSNKDLIGYKNIILDENNKKIKLSKKGMIIDLGAIAKGYAADEVYKILKKNGINHAIVNLGGNIFALGSNPKGEPWKIGVQNPLTKRGNSIGTLDINNQSVVTSGIYERYFEKDGKRYHHIINPFTGYPVDSNLASVTIISDKSIDGDALSTATFCLGVDKGMKLVENLRDVDAIFVTKDSKVYVTSGIKDNFKITNTSFKLVKS
ncbi:thiamine biosynthesis lipoprotein ApbE precursor [Clostridium acetireducens DSM 10703]|uniref:FAD:protein FMN transferase n=1 Tax=Clostridium acetireducens DSM 10703 TaxID=1121290 RepID=A0A1E8EY13_9CLOT|nr:FAD:protein FMN transferase [Clostridium acetireducens]OFI05825.1 thiamine biosynthesis lipoprotein ApbE precursor [Clostridium acetireducens DSM 10703]